MGMRIDELRIRIASGRANLNASNQQIESMTKKLEEAKQSLSDWYKAQSVLQDASAAVQTAVHGRISDVVTKCLQTVYDESISFHIEFQEKRGKTEARLYFQKDGNEFDPIEASGLGMVEVAAFALRLTVLKLHSPPVAQVLILDEAFRMLDAEAKPRMAELLMELSKEMKIQIVLVTHDLDFEVGKVIKI